MSVLRWIDCSLKICSICGIKGGQKTRCWLVSLCVLHNRQVGAADVGDPTYGIPYRRHQGVGELNVIERYEMVNESPNEMIANF
ncbi:hypothetical protein RIR_jg41789.t1 [Rhizophagus irregularis DAOM 181602=DAOM 197198]|nr:hypothetical protein RIR_jg41789.t1 [Rhizophagus irregularis DAOM 181602=DAOM 197198]